MCRNIRVLHHFEPPTTDDEIRAAALQYIRKVSGLSKVPASEKDAAAFERAIAEVASTTKALLGVLPSRGAARTRDGEKEKARIRWTRREGSTARGVGSPLKRSP